jgi:hypothetical protein
VSRSLAVRKKFGRGHWIWSEPEFLKKVATTRIKTAKDKN